MEITVNGIKALDKQYDPELLERSIKRGPNRINKAKGK